MPTIKNPLQTIKDFQRKRADRPKQFDLPFGEQDVMDVISYPALKEEKSSLMIGDRYTRTLFISGYPRRADTLWLQSLVDFNHSIDISFHIEAVDTNVSLLKLKRKITELESAKHKRLESSGYVEPEIKDPLNDAKKLYEGIKRGEEKLFQVSIYANITTDTFGELQDITKLLVTNLSARLFKMTVATYQQLEGLQSILPRGENDLAQKRNLNTSSAARAFPFMASEIMHPNGVLFGINDSDKSLVIVDRYALQNANSVMFATSGAGKSYTAKVEILRQLERGTKVIVIDPEREYENLAHSVEGTYIKLSATSKDKINPFDLATTSHTKDDLAEHAQDLTQVISLMAEGLNDREKAAVDKAILKIYREAKNNQPLLSDMYAALKDLGQMVLCEKLEKYISGTLSEVFNAPTNIKLDNRLVVFDIKDLPETLRPIMMLIVANFVNNQVKADPEKRLLVIDEGWILLKHKESADFVANMVRRARKYYLGVSIITQQADDFLESQEGQAIVSNCSLRILLKQDSTSIEKVAKHFRLSSKEERSLQTAGTGHALIIADEQHAFAHIRAAEAEDELITTDPKKRKKVGTKTEQG